MTIRNKFVFPLPKSDDEFEDMVRDACSIEWDDSNTQRYGRHGQSQKGLDVFGYPNGSSGRCCGAQAKLRTKGNKLSEAEIDDEVRQALSSPLHPEKLIIVTSTDRDTSLQVYVDKVSRELTNNHLLALQIWFWDDLIERLRTSQQFMLKYYKDFIESITNPAEAEDLVNHPIFVLIETCGDTSNTPNLLEQGFRMRGARVCRDRNLAFINGRGPDGIVCIFPDIKEKPDELLMQKFSSLVKSYENSSCPVFAIIPEKLISLFKEFHQKEDGNIKKIHINLLRVSALDCIKPIFIEVLKFGYNRRGALTSIDICARTMKSLPKSALLDLDWSPEFEVNTGWPGQGTWDTVHSLAIKDVVDGLLGLGKNIQLNVDCRLYLPVALAFGYYLNLRLVKASVWARNVGSSVFSQRFWDSDAAPAPITVCSEEIEGSHEQSSHMIVEISSQGEIHSEIKAFTEIEKLKYGKWLKIDLIEHQEKGAQINASYAVAYADQVGKTIRRNKIGYSDIHVFICTPSPLAFLIGQRLLACGRVHLYWYMNPAYRKAFFLN